MDNEDIQLELDLQAFTYAARIEILPHLTSLIDAAGGWVLERKPLSPDTMEIFLEVQSVALPEVYGALVSSGLELTRDAHRTLAERCNCTLHLRPRRGVSSILALRLEVHFLIDPPQPTDLAQILLMRPSAA